MSICIYCQMPEIIHFIRERPHIKKDVNIIMQKITDTYLLDKQGDCPSGLLFEDSEVFPRYYFNRRLVDGFVFAFMEKLIDDSCGYARYFMNMLNLIVKHLGFDMKVMGIFHTVECLVGRRTNSFVGMRKKTVCDMIFELRDLGFDIHAVDFCPSPEHTEGGLFQSYANHVVEVSKPIPEMDVIKRIIEEHGDTDSSLLDFMHVEIGRHQMSVSYFNFICDSFIDYSSDDEEDDIATRVGKKRGLDVDLPPSKRELFKQ